MKAKIVDVGQTCVRCTKYRGNGESREFFCMEYERNMDGVKYICKNFVDMGIK